jgi:hypothetical protein
MNLTIQGLDFQNHMPWSYLHSMVGAEGLLFVFLMELLIITAYTFFSEMLILFHEHSNIELYELNTNVFKIPEKFNTSLFTSGCRCGRNRILVRFRTSLYAFCVYQH